AAFGVAVEHHPELTTMLERTYGDRLTPEHLAMARVPAGARLLGTADIRWPTVVMNNVWILPGVPEIFRMKLAVVRAHLRGAEAELKPLLDRVVEAHPEVEVGSYPKWFDPTYRTKVTFDGRQADAVQRALEALLALLPEGEPQRLE